MLVHLATSVPLSEQNDLELVLRITKFSASVFGINVCQSLMVPMYYNVIQKHNDKLGIALVKSEELSNSGFVSMYCGLLGCCPGPMKEEISTLLLDCVVAVSTSHQEMDSIFSAFTLLAPAHLQTLLSVVWDCVVHPLPAVRVSAARLAEHLSNLVDTSVLSSRLFSALVTLSNDAQM